MTGKKTPIKVRDYAAIVEHVAPLRDAAAANVQKYKALALKSKSKHVAGMLRYWADVVATCNWITRLAEARCPDVVRDPTKKRGRTPARPGDVGADHGSGGQR